jgi:putative ABC transport system ATP-binding protein
MTARTLTAVDVTVARAGRTILDGVTLRAEPGERVAIVGPSGAGKSTLLATLAGLERPDSGSVALGGVEVGGVGGGAGQFGIVLQGYGLLSLLTAAENVELALQARRMPPAEVRSAAARLLAAVGLTGRAGHLVEELSGGEQQRVAVARALVTDPDIVLADEPTAELDAAARTLVLDLLIDSTRPGRTLLIATHDPEVAARCDRTVNVSGGRIVP